MELKVGDKVRRIREDHNGMVSGDTDIVNVVYPSSVDLVGYGVGHTITNLEKIDNENSPDVLKENMTKKKIMKVLAVDKITGEVLKNESVVAENEQTAILKAFGVDVEKVYIKTTEEGEFEEEKPVKVIMDKPETEKPKK